MSNTSNKSIGRGPGYSESKATANLLCKEIAAGAAPWKTGMTIVSGGNSYEEKEFWFTYPDPSTNYGDVEVTIPVTSGCIIRDVTDLWVYDNTVGLLPMASPASETVANVRVVKEDNIVQINSDQIGLGGGRGRIKFTEIVD